MDVSTEQEYHVENVNQDSVHWFYPIISAVWSVLSFSTFFLLSYVKILSVSADLLVFTAVHQLPDNKTHYRIYYDVSVELFRGSHIPYALLAATLAIVFIMIPTLILMLYPFQCFQKCLSYYRIQWHFIRAFVDSFQVAIRMELNQVHMTYDGFRLMVLS